MKTAMIVLGASLILAASSGCIKVRHLGKNTGKNLTAAFDRHIGDDVQHAPMEAELAEVTAKRFVNPKGSDKFKKPTTLVLPSIQ